MKLKTLLSWTGIAIVSASLAACSSNPPADADSADTSGASGNSPAASEQVTLQFWNPPQTADDSQFIQPIIDRFEAENPGIKINFTIPPWESLTQNLTAAFVGGQAPDVFYLPSGWFPQFADGGHLADLNSDRFASHWQQLEPLLTEETVLQGQYKGRQYGVPWVAISGWQLLYNEQLLQEAGYDRAPQTWDEWVEAAQKLTIVENGTTTQWGMGIPGNERGMFSFNLTYGPFWQAGADLVTDDLSKAAFNTPEGLTGITFFADLIHKHKAAPPIGIYKDYEIFDAFFEGKIAMVIGGTDTVQRKYNDYPDFPLGSDFWPEGPGGSRLTNGAVGMLFVPETAKHPEEAMKFISYLSELENSREFLQAVGFASTLKDSEDLYPDMPETRVFTQFDYLGPNIPLPFSLWDVLGPAMQEVMTGKDPQAALDAAEESINRQIQANQ
ncbi:ABC transporter substrate-binding protein [Paenibacillus senegalensis]|uniref:ABC transporter substrate-binding protein n=1 Tax=Paenibacillus senegalensis TaxID=1465766 RepID=UPI0002884DE7|nr:sugar ABC transporter substrate-binding protein [Paenibacillus senegalensis]